MKGISAVLWVESMKIVKSKMLWITILFFIFIPFMMGLLMFVQKYPETASKLGMIGTKAAMLRFGTADWQTYLGLLTQVMAGIGLLGFGFIISWIFGREYSDHTIKDLLALPFSRSLIVYAKFFVSAIWCGLLCVILFVFGLIAGIIIQLSGWSGELVIHNANIFLLTSILTIFLCTPAAFFASYGRGYLLPIGFIILTLIISQFSGLVGLGPYFPWSIPGLYSVDPSQIGMVSYIILSMTSLLGLIGTLSWWRFADQK